MQLMRRIFAVIVLSSSFALLSATPAHAAVKEDNTKIETCVQKAIADGTNAGECTAAPSLILPAKGEILWGGGSFLLLCFLMYKKAFPMVKKGMDARTEKIRTDLDGAESAKTEASQILTQYQDQLKNAKAEANRIMEETRTSAEAMRKDLIARAEAEVSELRERNVAEINSAKDRLLVDLRSDVTGMAIELAEKVVEKNLDKKTNEALVEQYITQVGAGK